MSRKLTSSDRTRLIKLASSMEKGSPERKAILAGLKVARTNWKVVRLSPSTLAKATAVNWWYRMKSGMFGEYIAIRVPSKPDMWALTRGERFDPRKYRNVSSAELLRLWEKVGGWVPSDQGGTPYDPSGESPSHEALHATGDGEALISMDPLPEYRQWRNIRAGLDKTASEGSLDRFMRDWYTKLSLDMAKMAESKMKVHNLGPHGFSFTLDFWTDSARNLMAKVDGQVRLIGIGSRAKLELKFGNEEWTFPIDTPRKAIVAKWRELNSYDDHPFARRSAESKTAYSDKFGLRFNFRAPSGFSFQTVPVDPPYNQTYSGFILMKKSGRVKAYKAAMDYIRKNEAAISRMKRTREVFDAINGYARQMTGKEPYWHRYIMPD